MWYVLFFPVTFAAVWKMQWVSQFSKQCKDATIETFLQDILVWERTADQLPWVPNMEISLIQNEFFWNVCGIILILLFSRRTFGIKLKITLSGMRDDEGRLMAGPWISYYRVVFIKQQQKTQIVLVLCPCCTEEKT